MTTYITGETLSSSGLCLATISLMQIYFFTGDAESSELKDLESRIRSNVPNLRKLANLGKVTSELPQNRASATHNQVYIIFPILTATSSDRMADIAEQDHGGIFFIFVSSEISASDYKRLVRSGGADWVSTQGAPQEIADIISRTAPKGAGSGRNEQVRPAIAVLVPSTGGVGNATLAIETAVQVKRAKQTRSRRVCFWISICRAVIFAIISISSPGSALRRSSRIPTAWMRNCSIFLSADTRLVASTYSQRPETKGPRSS